MRNYTLALALATSALLACQSKSPEEEILQLAAWQKSAAR
jgi:hypothetical protein